MSVKVQMIITMKFVKDNICNFNYIQICYLHDEMQSVYMNSDLLTKIIAS